MKIKLNIKTLKNQKQYKELAKLLTKEHNNNLDIYPKRLSMMSMDVATISGIVAATATVIHLVYDIYKYIQDKEIKWDMEELKNRVETECAKSGIVNIKIIEISNFNTLIESNGLTCTITIQTEKNENHKVHLSKSGHSFMIK